MKRLLSILLLAGAILLSGSLNAATVRPSGRIETELRQVKNFSGVVVSSGINLYISQSPVQEVKVKTDANIIGYVETTVKNGVLTIGFKNNFRTRGKFDVAVYISMSELNSIMASSGSDVKAKAGFKGKKLTITASSAANIKAIVEYDNVDITCSSGADVHLKGKAGHCNAVCSSGADINTRELICLRANAVASSGADINIYASESFNGSAASGADITYYGAPKEVNKSASSGGSIRAGK